MSQTSALHVLVDGDCPLCKREGAYIQKLDRGRGLVIIDNIADLDFDPSIYGLTRDQVMGAIHAIRFGPDGRPVETISGLEVFRQVYKMMGGVGRVLSLLLIPTRWPVIRLFADAGYRWFARNRLWLTGKGHRCDNGRCAIK